MGKIIDINTGDRFNRLTIIREVDPYISPRGKSQRRFLCKCDCGKETIVVLPNLRNGNTKSCGCYIKEIVSNLGKKNIKNLIKFNITHGDSYSIEYRSWSGMKTRCYNINEKGYKNYGGRGITVCDRWLESYENFLEDMGRKPGPEYSIDRINNDLGYSKENCRWATKYDQTHNREKIKRKNISSDEYSRITKLGWETRRKRKKDKCQT